MKSQNNNALLELLRNTLSRWSGMDEKSSLDDLKLCYVNFFEGNSEYLEYIDYFEIEKEAVLLEKIQKISKLPLKKNQNGLRIRDLRGVECPRNFAKVSLELHVMAFDDVIEVWLDCGAPIENVPSSVVQLGHKITSREKCDGFWKIQIVKKEVD